MTKVFAAKLPFFATVGTFLLLILTASLRYKGFFSAAVFLNLLDDNAFLGIAAIGMTFVILTGGIDLSVGATVGLSSILLANLVQAHGQHPLAAGFWVLSLGIVFGTLNGMLIWFFELPPFLVTLAAMFLARGLAYTVSIESLQLDHPFFSWILEKRLPLGTGTSLPPMALLFVCLIGVASFVSRYTRFGRNVYAFGGSRTSAIMMGIPAGLTQILAYSLSGGFAALAGIVYATYTASGNASAGSGLELDAIAAVVIGGTLLQGGAGSFTGTFLGVLILGAIQTIVTFENTVSGWWTKIIVGGLLLTFVLLQKFALKLLPRRIAVETVTPTSG